MSRDNQEMGSAVQIRPGTRDDLDALYELDLLCFPEPFRFDLELMRRLVSDPREVVIVAESEQGLVGFAIATLRRRRAAVLAYITTLDVHPEERRAGTGGRLMAAAELRCLELGAKQITLHVWTENVGSTAFYEANGYVRRGMVAGYYGEAGNAWLYTKSLVGTA